MLFSFLHFGLQVFMLVTHICFLQVNWLWVAPALKQPFLAEKGGAANYEDSLELPEG